MAYGSGQGPDPSSHDAPDAWVEVAAFPTRPFAEFVASALEGNGIAARVVGDDGGGMLMHLDTLSGGVHVQVRASDVEAAADLLDSLGSDDPAEDESPTGAVDHAGPGATTPAPIAARSAGPWRTILVLLVITGLAVVVAAAFLEL